jgi:hypothetical protein
VSDEVERLETLRAVLMSQPPLRARAESVVEEMLMEIAEADDDASAQAWLEELGDGPVYGSKITFGELRSRLRVTLADLAASDHSEDWRP